MSFAPASQFGAIGPHFRLLFGTAVSKAHAGPPAARDLFGYAVHHAVRAQICLERSRLWQAEYWISSLRDNALSLACRRRGRGALIRVVVAGVLGLPFISFALNG